MTSSIKSEVRSLNPSPYNDYHIRNQQEGVATADKINILGVGGSMRQGSYSTLTLKLVLEEAKKYQSETCLLELGKITLPLYNPSEASSDYTSSSYNNNNNYHLEKSQRL
ncbi:MAG: NADPH-dependent FMN reductase [Nitrososphaeraceae archaeon]